MSDEGKGALKDGLSYQEAGAVKSLLAPLKRIRLLGQGISRVSTERPTPQFQKPSIPTRFGTIIRELGLCGDTKDYDED